MKLKRIILISLFLLQIVNIYCQRIDYNYDLTGNRLGRILTTQLLKSDGADTSFYVPKNLEFTNAKGSSESSFSSGERARNNDSSNLTEMSVGTDDGQIVTNVYPNPNKGLIKIDISNMPLDSKNEMRLYDLSGNEIVIKRDFENHIEIDITQFKDGIYILRIKINDKIFDWKIVKNHY